MLTVLKESSSNAISRPTLFWKEETPLNSTNPSVVSSVALYEDRHTKKKPNRFCRLKQHLSFPLRGDLYVANTLQFREKNILNTKIVQHIFIIHTHKLWKCDLCHPNTPRSNGPQKASSGNILPKIVEKILFIKKTARISYKYP